MMVLSSFRVSVAISTVKRRTKLTCDQPNLSAGDFDLINEQVPFSEVSLVKSKVLLRTLIAKALASSRVISPSLYSCFKVDTAAYKVEGCQFQ